MGLFLKKFNKRFSAAGKENNYLLTEESGFAIQEAYKALRTNVIFSLPGGGSKCIGVTSATQGNGKSTNTLNMAISFGKIGKKVIVLDGDMRLPTVASKLEIKAVPGLSNILVGTSEPGECIQHVEAYNIDVIPSGVIPPDTTVLLQSSQMGELISFLKENYDYIFIDLPPALATIDPILISPFVDGFLVVVKHGESEYRSVSAMLNQMKHANARILGAIYSNADLGGKGKGIYRNKYYKYGGSYEKE